MNSTLLASRCISIIHAPCHLGLRPPSEGIEPGVWRAPQALQQAGLDDALLPVRTISMARPHYAFDVGASTQIRNAPEIRTFCSELANHVEQELRAGYFPVVIGGDCSILLGCLAGARRLSEIGLVHMDGHSDFRHPGNYDASNTIGHVAGMDLALATGRGERMLTLWGKGEEPLVPDARVVQFGERECLDHDYEFADIGDTAIEQIDIFWILEHGTKAALARTFERLGDEPYWLHVDIDVLDQRVMPSVDTPGSPGLDLAQAEEVIAALSARAQCLGLNVTIFDPDLDPDGRYAAELVGVLGRSLSKRS